METSVEELMADRLKDAFTFDSEYFITVVFVPNSIALTFILVQNCLGNSHFLEA